MNIFFLSRDPQECARFHHDKHVIKMILETAQILSTVHRRYRSEVGYEETHSTHPSVRWAGNNIDHYNWLHELGVALCHEYTFRYGKTHMCEMMLNGVLKKAPKKLGKNGRWIDPPQCMPDEYKADSTIEAYRRYYLGRKVEQSRWTRRPVPNFVKEVEMAKKQPKVEGETVNQEAQTQEAPQQTNGEAKPAVPQARGPKGVPETAIITLKVESNPKRLGSKARTRFDFYKQGMSVKEALDAGVLTADLVYDAAHGFVEIEGYTATVIQPKPKKEKKPKAEKTGEGAPVTTAPMKGDVATEVAA